MDTIVPFDQIGVTPPGPWQNANPSAGVLGSIPNADFFSAVLGELLKVQDEAGLTRNGADLTQVLQALRSGKLTSFVDTGSPDGLIVTPPTAYTAFGLGAEITIRKGASANATTTPTLTVGSLTRTIAKEDGSALAIGDLPAGCLFTVKYDGVALFRVVGLRKSDAASVAPLHLGTDTGTGAGQIVLTSVTGQIPPSPAGHAFIIITAHACGGATTAVIPGLNGGGPVSVLREDGSALQSGDWGAGDPIELLSDGTALRLVRLTITQILAQIPALIPTLAPSISPPRNIWSRQVAGTYTFTVGVDCPATVTELLLTAVGGGGGGAGGGGSSAWSGGGGGGGGTAIKWVQVTNGQVLNVVVGAAGPGSAQGNGVTASPGGTSSVGTLSATGGGGGQAGTTTSAGGAPGQGAGGQKNIYGGAGGDGNDLSATNSPGGNGGSSSLGGGGRTSTITTPANAFAPGSGGGGIWQTGGSNQVGGAGADGFVSIEW